MMDLTTRARLRILGDKMDYQFWKRDTGKGLGSGNGVDIKRLESVMEHFSGCHWTVQIKGMVIHYDT